MADCWCCGTFGCIRLQSQCGSFNNISKIPRGAVNSRIYNNNNNFIYTLKSKVDICSVVFTI